MYDRSGLDLVKLTPFSPSADYLATIRGNIRRMKITTGTVVGGKVLVEGEALPEGATVTVLLREKEESFELTADEEAELLTSIADVESGKFISSDELLERLRGFG
jgi:hypothetical protein